MSVMIWSATVAILIGTVLTVYSNLVFLRMLEEVNAKLSTEHKISFLRVQPHRVITLHQQMYPHARSRRRVYIANFVGGTLLVIGGLILVVRITGRGSLGQVG